MTIEVAVKQLGGALDTLLELDLTGASRDELLDLARGLERQRRRLPVADHRIIAELNVRAVAGELACASTPALLMQLLRLAPSEAKARLRAAGDLGPRRTLTGEPLDPIFPTVAAAQAAGDISDRHAAVIRHTVDHLPGAVADQGAAVERTLTEHARTFDPEQLARLARHVTRCLDPDGVLDDDHDHARRRDLTFARMADGSSRISGYLTPTCTAVWDAVLDPLSRPVPADDGGEPDRRAAGQRRHDAFEDAGRRLLAAGTLPDSGGTPATVLLTMTAEQARTGTGYASTEHGGLISLAEVLRLADEAEIVPVVLSDAGGILAYGRTRRIASPQQRQALAARDRGCSFPGCDRPPGWTQAHHVTSWLDGGATDLDNLTLLCGWHHREFAKRGWECTMIGGVPHWVPPDWLDRDQRPCRNTAHDTQLR